MKVTPMYKITKEVGPDHNKLFYVVCETGDKKLGKGMGKNKQQAEQKAAEDSLHKLENTFLERDTRSRNVVC